MVIIAILLLTSTLGIAKEINKAGIEEKQNVNIDLYQLIDMFHPASFKATTWPSEGSCEDAVVLTLGEEEHMSEFTVETSNKFKNFLINWYMNGLLWKILPRYEKQISLRKEDVTAKVTYSEDSEGAYTTWIVNITTLADFLQNLDPEDLQDPDILNEIMLNATEYMNGGITHTIDASYTPEMYENQIISDATFMVGKAILLKLAGIGKMYGFGAAYCSVSWSE
jgi:hypothetical protein